MSNELITRKSFSFKCKDLTEATNIIYDAASAEVMEFTKAEKAIDNKRKVIARTLNVIERSKMYKEDGFKSLAEYAEVIGLDKAMAHKLENAGRLLNSEDEDIKAYAERTSWSKLAILSSVPTEDIKSGIESGELDEESTQSDVQAFSKAVKSRNAKASDKVLPSYEVHITFGNGRLVDYDAVALEAIAELDGFVNVGTYRPESGEPIKIAFNPKTGELARYTAIKVKAPAKLKKAETVIDITNLSDDQLRALMEEYAKRQAEK